MPIAVRFMPPRSRAEILRGASLIAILSAAGNATAEPTAESAAQQLQTITVIGHENDYKADLPAISKLTEPLVDTPQTINSVTGQLIADQGITTLSDALRNVPGISLGAGEFSWQGTALTLRGFNARNDIYLDGMRDFGSYYRDPFNLEEVQVLEGPSSILFGRGSTGGVVNQTSKMPTMQPLYASSLSAGSDETRRLTADFDQPLPELADGAAVRLNLMGHDSMAAGRDIGEYRRYGFAPSLALGLGTPTRFNLSYFHQTENDTPDYGLPWFVGRPAPVPRQNFYGFRSDYLNTNADVLTASVEHDFSDDLSIRSRLRYADYYRDFRISEPIVPSAFQAGAPLASIPVMRNEWSGYSRETFLQSQTDLTAKLATGGLEHTLVAGVEAGPESSTPEFDNAVSTPLNTLLDPDENQVFSGRNYIRLHANTHAVGFAAYAMDTVKIGEQWEITGGIRWDRFDADFKGIYYSVPPAALNQITRINTADELDQVPSYRAAIVYKPASNASIYFDYGTSFDPSAETLSQITSGRSLGVGFEGLAPEKNRNFETGTKWDVLAGKLSLTAALFREEKTNARVPDPNNPGFDILGGEQQVDGIDLEAAGRLTETWRIHAGYTYLESTTLKSAPGAAPVGSPLDNTPKHSIALWTEYTLPFGLEIGGGATYLSRQIVQNTAPIERVPAYIEFDAMAKYELTSQIGLQVNVYNITDKYYYADLHAFHVIPGAGRSALFSVNFRY
ncbi:MAG TPA: TonB-dependent siderophore receptor [Alphaproteobacteria bacterium]|nr:TonB-dependent siderophore receptor [Alphaproteobacteria bacterium]